MNTSVAKKSSGAQTQEVCIDLPGETVQCWRSSDNIRVRLRKHRDIFFDINLKASAIYTVESAFDFYSPRDKKLLKRANFWDGERFNVWVGRGFKGKLVLKENDLILGTYEVSRLDKQTYDSDPKTKPEPLLVIMGKKGVPATFACTREDPFGVGNAQQLFKAPFDPKLLALKDFGAQHDYSYLLEPPEVGEYVAVTDASPNQIQPQVLEQLDRDVAVVGPANQIFVVPQKGQPETPLYRALVAAAGYISGNEFLTANSFKESIGYLQEHFESLSKIGMTVRIEKKAKGKYRVAFKGRPLTQLVGRALGQAKNAKIMHPKVPLGSHDSEFIDGGFGRTGKAGYGGVRRLMLTAAEKFRGGMKIQAIGTVIDIIVDANTVYFDEKGSKDFSEFLGRVGVSVLKAGVTAAIGSAIAMAGIAALTAAAAAAGVAAVPVIAVVAVVVAGYILTATIVDAVDDKFNIKNSVANWAR
jgi:hypothetical protein